MYYFVDDEEQTKSEFKESLAWAIEEEEEGMDDLFEEYLNEKYKGTDIDDMYFSPMDILYTMAPFIYKEKKQEFAIETFDRVYNDMLHGEDFTINDTKFFISSTNSIEEVNLYDDED